MKVILIGSDNKEVEETPQTSELDEVLKDYVFFKDLDFYDHDINCVGSKPIKELARIATTTPDCVAFNVYGYLKNQFNKELLAPLKSKLPYNGIFVKKSYLKTSKFRVKLLSNWDTSKGTCEHWNPNSLGNYSWNDIETTWEDKDVDFYVIFNSTKGKEFYVPERTIIFQMEPWCGEEFQKWGVKTWGEWSTPDPSKFLQVRTQRNSVNLGLCQLSTTFEEFRRIRIPKTKLMSTICSSKYIDPGHFKRVDFLRFVEEKNDPVVQIDIYNSNNDLKFKNYKGRADCREQRQRDNVNDTTKDRGIINYKYYFMAENNPEENFITEKIWEPLLCETLCFYWGCPNIADYVDPRAYIVLNLDNFEEAFNTVKTAILNNEWEKRVDIIRREKQKVLGYYGFFPTLERIIKHELKFEYHPTDEDVMYHKYFHFAIDERPKTVIFLHSCNLGDTSVLTSMINFVNNQKLLEKVDWMFVNNIGKDIKIDHPKIRYVNYSPDVNNHENCTMNLIRMFSKFNRDVKILYLHTKGVTYSSKSLQIPQNIQDWTNLMTYFLVEKHEECMRLLDTYDAVGVNKQEKPYHHFSGNFWWANSGYLADLPSVPFTNQLPPEMLRNQAEFWVLLKQNVRAYEMFGSKVNHYTTMYPRSIYASQ